MAKDIYKELGNRVRELRHRLDWTQENLAEKADLNPSYIGQIERGTKKISILTLQKLARAIGVPIAVLLDDCATTYEKSSWETRIDAELRDKSSRQQQFAFRLL